jgi:chromosome segregation ATPase
MDLTINRLKVLGESEIAKLDKTILEYKSQNNPTILNKDIETIKTQIKDLTALLQDLEREYISKETEYKVIKKELKKVETKYSTCEANLLTIENNISDTKAKLDAVNNKITEHPTN